MRKTIWKLLFIPLFLNSCGDKAGTPDAYGNFEADEVIVSAEVPGKILTFAAAEGERIGAGMQVAVIDSTDLIIKRKQLQARRKVIGSNEGGIVAEVAVIEEQISSLEREMRRIKTLVEKGAAAQRQYDDLESQRDLANKRIAAIRTKNSNIFSEMALVDAQIEEADAQIRKCRILSPLDGTVLITFSKEGELTGPGRPLCKIARLDSLYLRAYVSGSQLSSVKLGQKVSVQYDGPSSSIATVPGTVTWVSPEAEFTPKIIQTREDRVSFVYALKVKVPNDGSLKIGMPGELLFKAENQK